MSDSQTQLAHDLADRARIAARSLAITSSEKKTKALHTIADLLEARSSDIQASNKIDLDALGDVNAAFRDRLVLDAARIKSMADGVRVVASLTDPVGAIRNTKTLPNGLVVEKVAVPIGVIFVIFESRPNVTADAAALTLKSGNAVVLRGGKEAINTNKTIAAILSEGLKKSGLNPDSVVFVETTDRDFVNELLALEGKIDVVIPRGGHGLIRAVVENSRVPVIYHGAGICHVYVDKDADEEIALRVAHNAKCSRPGVCNAMETLLVHEAVAADMLPKLVSKLENVEIRGCEKTCAIVSDAKSATEDDWPAEFLDLILAVKVVSGVEEAIDHIETYGSHLADSIISQNQEV
ncbi:MAG: glutamate-5-semialdehyde dehydrogenase, partial [Candidatus Lindowbacteria bacterium]|nr:glutamate-5-semialdehyde dehydrogenase [Candidatus Lindowbacteria bacterium]